MFRFSPAGWLALAAARELVLFSSDDDELPLRAAFPHERLLQRNALAERREERLEPRLSTQERRCHRDDGAVYGGVFRGIGESHTSNNTAVRASPTWPPGDKDKVWRCARSEKLENARLSRFTTRLGSCIEADDPTRYGGF